MKLQVQHLSFTYTCEPFLKDISFSIDRNDHCIFLCGKNGAGKSTLLNLITGLLPAEECVTRNACRILFLPYQDPLVDNVSVKDNLQFFYRSFHHKNIPLDDPFVVSILNALSIDYLNKKMNVCSSGERKKIALACLLLADADLFILDEPFVAIDYQSVEAVISLINQFKQDTVFLITTHNFSLAPRLCDRLLLIEDGRLTKDTKDVQEIHSYFQGEE